MRHVRGILAILAPLVLAAAVAGPARACNVPVFRYALERWPPEAYTAYVFHRGPLTAEQQAVVKRLEPAGGGAGGGNIDLQAVDVSADLKDEAAEVWKQHASATLPLVVVRYPAAVSIPVDAWSGPLSDASVSLILDSPARRKVAKRILEGECAVFVLLETGNRAEDDRLAGLVEAELKRLEKTLELPRPTAGGSWDDPVYDRQGAPDLRLALSVLRLSRTDPAEAAFVQALLGTERGLRESAEPMVFAVFGRGRVLCALVGKGITPDNLETVAEFVVGPCSCVVKSENPGVDLVMTVDWTAALAGEASAIPEVEPPALSGLSRFAEGGAAPAGQAAADPPRPTAVRAKSAVLLAAAAAAGGILIVAVVGLVIWRRGPPARNSS